jgi:Peptidase family M1 domain
MSVYRGATAAGFAILTLASAASPQQTYQEVFQSLLALEPDLSQVASVSNLTIQRDVGRFELHEGTLYLLSPVAGRVVGAAFTGSGTFHFTPPTPIERDQLKRRLEKESLAEPFKTMILLFADSTAEQLGHSMQFGPGAAGTGMRREIEEALKYISDKDTEWFDSDLMLGILNGRRNDAFYAHVAQSRGNPLIFRVDPYEAEEISLSRRAKDAGTVPELVTSFHRAADYESATFESTDYRDVIQLADYEIESTIAGNLDFSARATFDVTATDEPVRWVPLLLYHELDVTSVSQATETGGAPLEWHRGDDATTLWLHFEPALAPGQSRRVRIAYEGDLIDDTDLLRSIRRRGDVSRSWMFDMKSTSLWFPRVGGRRAARFDLTFHTPSKYAFVSVGNPVSSEVNDDVRTSRWRTRETRNVAFNIGEFEEYEFKDERIPPVTLQVAESMHRSLELMGPNGQPVRFLQQDDMGDAVITDLSNSLSFFQDFFGPATVDQFYATEIPGYHGEAFAGVVLLSWLTYQWTDEKGSDDMFRAHEVAHQWWGIGVDYATYRDRWLSEGFSEFAGLWYMQMVRHDNKLYFDQLEEWRKDLLDRGEDAAPIWLGNRVANSEHPGDYQLVIYEKGAWVLHMLRNIFLDLDTMGESRFQALMSDFYQTYRGKYASTADFERKVEEHAGVPVDWFFDEWVRGSAIPRYRVSYHGSETTEGYRVTIRVAQEDVPDDFKMYVPLLVDFGADGQARLRMMVEGPLTEVDLPMMPRKPDRLVFNDLQSVLAEVKDDGWKN